MRRLSFLPLFFTALSIAFVVALTIRLRQQGREETARVAATAPVTPPAAVTRTVPAAETQTVTIGKPKAEADVRASARQDVGQAAARQDDGLKPVPHPPEPSALSRMLAPIMKALGAGASPKPDSNPQPRQQSTAERREREQPKDPNSDSSPPQLVSIEFVPPQVSDGEQATVVITAVDDLSGIRGISGTIGSPTGKALQGFAEQREGDSNRYLGRVTIPKNAEEGLWRVNFLNMSDNASNSVTLSYAQGTVPAGAVLRVVSSGNDASPPTLKNVWGDRRSMRGGEKNIIFVEASDDKSGVNLVSAVFQSPSKFARLGAGCKRGEGDVWQCELSVPSCLDCGDWQLEQITLQDKANNLATYRQDNPLLQAVRINIEGDGCDNTPPILQSLVLDNSTIVIGRDVAVVTVTLVTSDDSCGVSGVSGQFSGPGAGSGGFFPLQQGGDPSTWVGRLTLDPRAARGAWRINSIQLTDRGHNLRIYYANDPVLQNGVFHVR